MQDAGKPVPIIFRLKKRISHDCNPLSCEPPIIIRIIEVQPQVLNEMFLLDVIEKRRKISGAYFLGCRMQSLSQWQNGQFCRIDFSVFTTNYRIAGPSSKGMT